MKKNYLLLLLPFFTLTLHAQTFSCAVPHETHDKELLRIARLNEIKKLASYHKSAADEIIYVPIKMQLFGLDDNTGYADLNNVNDALAELNKQFKPVGVEFYFSGTDFNYYASSHFYNGDQTSKEDDAFRDANGVTDAINMYVANTVKVGTTGVGGYTFVAPQDQYYNRIWIYIPGLNDNKTTPHEMGHYFGLEHTFNNATSSDINERELVTRNFNELPPRLSANCDTEGDFVCDTPSDGYQLPDLSVNDCVYTGTAADSNGDAYTPSLSNIMNYYFCGPYNFTEGQYERMRNGKLLVTNAHNFTLDAPETLQVPPTDIKAYNSNDVYMGSTIIIWKDNSEEETGYIIEAGSSTNGPFIAVGGVKANVASFNFTESLPNTTYYFRVKPSNTKSSYSAVSGAVTTPTLCGNSKGQTCDANAKPDDAAWRIEDFTLSKQETVLISNQGSGCSQNGIGNYFDTFSAAIAPGDILDFNVKSKLSTTGVMYGAFVKIYADWNNNNDFNDANELVFSMPKSEWFEVKGQFTVPSNLPVGSFRLRVLYSATESIPSPCEANTGEIEDYKLVNTTVGLAGVKATSLVIYPNPASSVLNIQLPDSIAISSVTITDVSGKKVAEQTGASGQVNVQHLATGLYLIQVTAGDKKFIQKFIKQE